MSKSYKLIEINWIDYLKKIVDKKNKIFEKTNLNKYQTLSFQYIDYKIHFDYIKVIWKRLQNDYYELGEVDKQIENHFEKITNPTKINSFTIDFEDRIIAKPYYSESYMLDMDSFIIFSKILMDKIIKLTTSLLHENIQRSIPTNSFTDHRNFFAYRNPSISNQKYTEIIKNETLWYELALLPIRDKIITHGNSRITILGGPTGKKLGLTRTPHFRESELAVTKAKKLKEQLAVNNPEFSKVHQNVREFIEFVMEKNNLFMTKQQITEFHDLILVIGGTYPNPNYIAINIMKFILNISNVLED